MIELARGKGSVPDCEVSFVVDDAQRLAAFDADSFDGVTSQLALMDIPDLEATLSAVHRVLEPGGWFVFVIVHPCFSRPTRRAWRRPTAVLACPSPATSRSGSGAHRTRGGCGARATITARSERSQRAPEVRLSAGARRGTTREPAPRSTAAGLPACPDLLRSAGAERLTTVPALAATNRCRRLCPRRRGIQGESIVILQS